MPDWTNYVQRKLGPTGLPRDSEQEIVSELAGHLEDLGGATTDADKQVSDWAALAHEIRNAKEDYMSPRVRTFWIPAVVVDIIKAVLLSVLQFAGVHPTVILTQPIPMVIYWPWLVILPLVGGMGAYWSRRAGGSVRTRLLVALFPSIVLGVVMIVFALGSMVAALFVPAAFASVKFLAIAAAQTIAVWVVLPAIPLAMGALPFLGSHHGADSVRSEAATA